ncbi:flavodoxin family protein [Prolixibacteraceae bacterium Z1-6]|uniref:Flavodoxin family protein n=1 Tax=Draconibacterium aestuarii TaxID=2998507 RepID=A0A9X3F1H8_9BACT|nr:flavodoxin family protein [Prolixibacteraceae bacterium Z1-6]
MNKKIVILNGDNLSGKTPVNDYLSELEQLLTENGEEVRSFVIRDKNVKQCVGCFDCWVKTPGCCRFQDDVEEILRAVIRADLLLFASPLILGMYSAVLKRFQDRMIPIIHPYLEIVNNECHHKKRYPKYPKLGFIFDEKDASPEEIKNVHFIHQRMVLNLHSELSYFESVQQKNPKELSHEISHI